MSVTPPPPKYASFLYLLPMVRRFIRSFILTAPYKVFSSLEKNNQGFIFFCFTPPGGGGEIWPNNMLGKNLIEKG